MAVEVTTETAADLTYDGGRPLPIDNRSGVDTRTLAADPQMRRIAAQLTEWVETARATGAPASSGNLFDRTTYTPPDTPYDHLKVARKALREDDIISGIADATEAMAFEGGLKWESSNPDDADVFNQLSAELNLDAKIREMWREEFTTDQFVCAKLWGWSDYTVRGKTAKGNKKKKSYRVWVPQRLVVLDPLHVVPIGHGPLREDRLAWSSSEAEIGYYAEAYAGDRIDPLMTSFFLGTYTPGADEQRDMLGWGVRYDRLLAMNPDYVFRHCSTRPDYAKWSDIRLRSVFPLLDMKKQLMASDRATLVGAANYILLIRKGSDAAPAVPEEIAALKEGYNFLAKLPVIISDHRLEVEIIAPRLDFVLRESAYDVIDKRILARALSGFVAPGTKGTNSGNSDTFENALAKNLQNRRHMIRRTLEKEIARAVVNHPKNAGLFEAVPSMVFTPRSVSVGRDQAYLAQLATLRTQREVSRDTILEYMGLDQSTEAQRLQLEEEIYDQIFKTQIPFSATPGADPQDDQTTQNGEPEDPATSGRRGGRPRGGGNGPQSPQATTRPTTTNGNPTTRSTR
jgi:hypothetical protein